MFGELSIELLASRLCFLAKSFRPVGLYDIEIYELCFFSVIYEILLSSNCAYPTHRTNVSVCSVHSYWIAVVNTKNLLALLINKL